MEERKLLVAVLLGLAVLVTLPMLGMGGADEHTGDNDTAVADPAPGEQLAGAMSVQEGELDTDIEKRSFEKEIERSTDEEREALAQQRIDRIETELDELESRAETLKDRYETGELTRGQFHSSVAQLKIEAESKADIAERAGQVVGDAEIVTEQEETLARIVDIRTRAEGVTDRDAREAVEDLIHPSVGDDPARSAEAVADRLAGTLERADRQAHERDTVVRDGLDLDSTVADEEYTISIRDSTDGGLIQITTAESDVSISTEFDTEATVGDTDLSGGPVSYAVDTREIAVFSDEERDEPDDSAHEEATAIAERLALNLERADRRAQETGERVSDRLDLPTDIRDSEYEISVEADEADGGEVRVETADGAVSVEASFSSRASAQDTDIDGGPTTISATPQQLLLSEATNEPEDPAVSEAGDIGDRIASALAQADRLAHDTDSTIRSQLELPETIDGQEYWIGVRDTSIGGIVQVATSDREVTYTTEFRAASPVESVRLDPEQVFYRASPDVLVLVDSDGADEGDEDEYELAGDRATAISERLAAGLERADRHSQETSSTISATMDLPTTIGSEEYTITLEQRADGGLIDIVTADGAISAEANFTASGTVQETVIDGGMVEYRAGTNVVQLASLDDERDREEDDKQEEEERDEDEERDGERDDDDDDDDDREYAAVEVAEIVIDSVERVDAQTDDGPHMIEVELPDRIDGERYGIAIGSTDGTGAVHIVSPEGERLYFEEFSVETQLVDTEGWGGDLEVSFEQNPDRILVSNPHADEDEDDHEDDSDDRGVTTDLIEAFQTADERAQEHGTIVQHEIELPDSVHDQRYQIRIDPHDDGGEITVVDRDGNRIDHEVFVIGATLEESAQFDGGEIIEFAVDPEQFTFGEREEDNDDDEDEDQDDGGDDGMQANELTEELVGGFEAADERAQEHDTRVEAEFDLPHSVDDQWYEVTIDRTGSGGEITIWDRDGNRLHSDSFQIEATLGDSPQFEAGETIGYIADPDEFRI